MGLFTKKENIHFERNEAGEVVNVERTGDTGRRSRTPISDELMKQSPKAQRKLQRIEQRKLEKQAYRKAYNEARIKSAKQRGKQQGSMTIGQRFDRAASQIRIQPYTTRNNYNPWGSMFDRGMSKPKATKPKYHVVGGKAYPIAGSKKKSKKNTNTGIGSFDMMDNWGFMK